MNLKKLFDVDGELKLRFAIDDVERINQWLTESGTNFEFAKLCALELDDAVFGKCYEFPCTMDIPVIPNPNQPIEPKQEVIEEIVEFVELSVSKCPFCGYEYPKLIDPLQDTFIYVKCSICGACGPNFDSDKQTEAVNAWNNVLTPVTIELETKPIIVETFTPTINLDEQAIKNSGREEILNELESNLSFIPDYLMLARNTKANPNDRYRMFNKTANQFILGTSSSSAFECIKKASMHEKNPKHQ